MALKRTKTATTKKAVQRATIYQTALWNERRVKQAYELSLLGLTDQQMADLLEIKIKTWEYWKQTRKDFAQALKDGKTFADAKVAAALFKKATGFYYKDTVINTVQGKVIKTPVMRYSVPDTFACWKWLTIRQREAWCDLQRSESTLNIQMQQINFNGITDEELQMLEQLGMKRLMGQLSAAEQDRSTQN